MSEEETKAGISADEKAAIRRAQLYADHKVRGTLAIYYDLYPDERPIERDTGRER